MILYAYLQPDVIEEACNAGHMGLQRFITVLKGFCHNCVLFDFQDSRVQTVIGEKVQGIPNKYQNERKLIEKQLKRLVKRNRFMWVLEPPSWTGETSTEEYVQSAIEQAADQLIDLALVDTANSALEKRNGWPKEITTFSRYIHTEFEDQRSRWAEEGKQLREGEMPETDFLNVVFDKTLRHAQRIDVYDRLFGKYYGDNYEYTAKKFFGLLGRALETPTRCKLIFHCEEPPGKKAQYMKDTLTSFKNGILDDLDIEIQFYEQMDSRSNMMHQRYFVTDQISLSLDRGMDFLRERDGRNRDADIDYKGAGTLKTVLRDYRSNKNGQPQEV